MKPGDRIVCAVWIGLLMLALALGCAGPAPQPPQQAVNDVPNLSQVEPSIWRGGQPASSAEWWYLRSLGLTNDIKLNTEDEASDQAAIAAGFRIFAFPIDTMEQLVDGPDPGAMRAAVAAIRPGTYVHCEHGQDRTGLVVGLYWLQEGTNAAAAWQEMIARGYHPALLGLTRFWEEWTEHPTPNIQHPTSNEGP